MLGGVGDGGGWDGVTETVQCRLLYGFWNKLRTLGTLCNLRHLCLGCSVARRCSSAPAWCSLQGRPRVQIST
jgi:hypothetical protein